MATHTDHQAVVGHSRGTAGKSFRVGPIRSSTETDVDKNEARRAILNPEIRKWTTAGGGGTIVAGVHADAVADVAANATIGILGVGAGGSGTKGNTASGATGVFNTDYYSDLLHLTALTQSTIVEPIVRPLINSL
jgi:hypothetical protein